MRPGSSFLWCKMVAATIEFVFRDDGSGGGGSRAVPGAASRSQQQAVDDATRESKLDKSRDSFLKDLSVLGRVPGLGFLGGVGQAGGRFLGATDALGRITGNQAGGFFSNAAATATGRGVAEAGSAGLSAAGRAARASRAAKATVTGTALVPSAAGGGGGALATIGGGALVPAGGGGAAVAAMSGLAAVAIPLLGALAAGGALVLGIKALVSINRQLNERSRMLSERFQQFSSDLQISNARSQVERLQQDVAFARTLGPRLARFNRAQDKMALSIDRLTRTVEGPILDALIPILESVSKFIVINEKVFTKIIQILDDSNLLKFPGQDILEALNNLVGAADVEANKLPPEADILGFFNQLSDLEVTWNGRKFNSKNGQLAANPVVANNATIPQSLIP